MTYEAYDEPKSISENHGFSNQLSREVARISGYGMDGLHQNECVAGKLVQDKKTPKTQYNFNMSDDVFQLGCALELKNKIAR